MTTTTNIKLGIWHWFKTLILIELVVPAFWLTWILMMIVMAIVIPISNSFLALFGWEPDALGYTFVAVIMGILMFAIILAELYSAVKPKLFKEGEKAGF